MSSSPSTNRPCQHCGNDLPDNYPEETCPACLMGEALEATASLDTGGHEDSPSATGRPAGAKDPLEGTTLGPGGRYKILQRIGEGGFGTVFMAEQTAPVRRRVAVKILKAGMDTRQVVARFEAERQALAMMDHPNIAKVLDGGETDHGRPFFVMELVRGTPITAFCDREKLDTRARLDLFLDVCRAVQHAHQKGIIHRDLKPGNILVTVEEGTKPVPKVIDFGVAKAMESNLTDKTLFTRFEQMIGTPAYMSPEQAGADAAANDVDTRADIYALGVLLYELLTGSTPFESETLQNAAFDEVRRILREEDAPRPSARFTSLEASRRQTLAHNRNASSAQSLDKLLRGDLDWIVMRAIEKDRRRRYETANAFALDLERFLADEPVSAGPPTARYRLQKFARRHKSALAAAATILVVLVAAAVISVIAAFKAIDAEHRATKNFTNLQTAYTDLDTANKTVLEAQQKTRDLLVHTLLEKGTNQFNGGEVTGLIALQEAVAAAEGNKALQTKAMELWKLAHSWLPGSVEQVIDDPYAVAIAPDGSMVAWCDAEQLHTFSIVDRIVASVGLNLHLLSLTEKGNGEHLDVLALTFGPNSRQLAIHNPETGIAQVWDARSLVPLTGLLRHPGTAWHGVPNGVGMTLARFNPSGDRLVTLAANETVCLWNIERGDLAIPHWKFRDRPKGAAFSADGRFLAIGHNGNRRGDYPNVFLFDLQKPAEPKASLAAGHRANKFAFVDNDHLVIRGGEHVYLWDLALQSVLETPQNFYEDISLSPDRQSIAIGSRDGQARLVSALTLEGLGDPLEHGGGGVRCVAFGPGGSSLVTGGLDGSLQTWSLGETPYRFAKWPQRGNIDQIACISTGSRYYVSKSRTRDKSLPHGAMLRTFPEPVDRVIATLPEKRTLMDLSPEGDRILIRSDDFTQLWLWDRSLGGGFASASVKVGPRLAGSGNQITSAVFCPDGTSFVVCTALSESVEFTQWAIDDNAQTHRAEISGNYPAPRVASSQASMQSVIAWFTESWSANFLDLAQDKELLRVGADARVAAITSPRPGNWFSIISEQGTIRRFSSADYKELSPPIISGRSIVAAAHSLDGRWLLTEFRDPEREGRLNLEAWFVGGPSPFFSIRLPGARLPGRRDFPIRDLTETLSITLTAPGRLCPVDECSFIVQLDNHLIRIDLPDISASPHQVEGLTQGALGVRKRSSGQLDLLTAEEFQKAKSGSAAVR